MKIIICHRPVCSVVRLSTTVRSQDTFNPPYEMLDNVILEKTGKKVKWRKT